MAPCGQDRRRLSEKSLSASSWFRTVGSISEGKFDTELNLTRGLSWIQGAKRVVSDIKIIADEVGVIEDVEEFRTELESITLLEAPIFRHREVDVCDRHSSHCPLAQRSQLAGRRCSKGRLIQVSGWITLEIDRSSGVIRTLSNRARSTKGIGASYDVNRCRTEVRANRIQLPITERKLGCLAPTLERRQDVDDVANESMPSIEVSVTLITSEVERIARRVSERRQCDVRDRVAPGICNLERKLIGEATVEPQLHRMVAGVTIRLVRRDVSNVAEQAIVGNQLPLIRNS